MACLHLPFDVRDCCSFFHGVVVQPAVSDYLIIRERAWEIVEQFASARSLLLCGGGRRTFPRRPAPALKWTNETN